MSGQVDGRSTHGLAIKCEEGGVKRHMALCRFASGSFSIRMTTTWSDGSEPIVTEFGLSPIGLEMLSRLVASAHELHEYPSPPAVDQDPSND